MNDHTSEQPPKSVVNDVIIKGSAYNYIQLFRIKIKVDLKASNSSQFLS